MAETKIETVKVPRWGWWITIGILLMILGIVLLSTPVFATLTSLALLGTLLVLAGIANIACAFLDRNPNSFWMHLLIAALTLVVGILMLANPKVTLLALTLLIAAFFLCLGLFRILTAVIGRFEGWGWVLLNGAISLLLGILILIHWPSSSLWVIGLFVGIDFLFAGWTLIMTALFLKKQRVVI
jgi:uncharacterized membrane protein HdeD (DUF308 family)